jgi:cytochrome c oxidase subunit 3
MPNSAALTPEIQYADLEQQGDVAQLGMWAFLVNETLFFGALIFTYFLYRTAYPHDFAIAANDTVLWCGSVNLGLLLTSSLTMVLGVNAGAQGRRRDMIVWLLITLALGCAFLGFKCFEYVLDYHNNVVPAVNYVAKPGEGPAGKLFWIFYWVATGLHALHLTIGLGLIVYMLRWRIRRGEITPAYYAPLEVVAIYWSFVDTVWLFLFPCIYLVGRS